MPITILVGDDYSPWAFYDGNHSVNAARGVLVDILKYFCSNTNVSCNWLTFELGIAQLGSSFIFALPSPMMGWDEFTLRWCYSNAFSYDDIVILSGKPKEIEKENDVFNSIFSGDVEIWFFFAPLMFLVSLVVYAHLRFFPTEAKYSSFCEILWNTFGGLFYEAFPHLPRKPILRCVVLLWICGTFCFVSLISCKLKAGFTISVENSINSLEDVVSKPWLKPMIVKPDIQRLLKDSSVPIYRATVDQHNKHFSGQFPNFIDGLNEVPHGQIVMINSYFEILYGAARLCKDNPRSRLYFGSQVIMQVTEGIPIGPSISRDTLNNLNIRLRRASEAKLTEKHVRHLQFQIEPCLYSIKPSDNFGKLNLGNMKNLMIMYLCGLLISVIALACEIASKNCCTNKQ